MTDAQQELVRESEEAIDREVGVYLASHPHALERHSRSDLLQQARLVFCQAILGGREFVYAISAARAGIRYYACKGWREQPTDADVVDDPPSNNDHEFLHKVLNRLPAKERRVLLLRYGLGGNQPHSVRQAAAKLKTHHSWVQKMQKRAEASVAAHLAHSGLVSPLNSSLPPAP